MKHRSTKDTKRWCLGRKGREHEPQYEPMSRWYHRGQPPGYPDYLQYRCRNCRRMLRGTVSSMRRAFCWLDARGVAHDYNMTGFVAVPFYGPGLPSTDWGDRYAR